MQGAGTPAILIAAFGLPGVMAAWGVAAIRAIAGEALVDPLLVETDRLEAFEAARLQAGPQRPVVLISQFPEGPLIDAVMAAGGRPILFLESMAGSAAYTLETIPESPLSLIRALSASAACLAPLRELPDVLAMHRDTVGRRHVDVLLAYMCRHLGLDASEAALARCGRRLASPESDPAPAPDLEASAAAVIAGYLPPGGSCARQTPDVVALVDKVLAPLDALFEFRSMPPIVWPGSVFLQGDRPDQPMPDDLDITGAARCLIYGPYLHVPKGEWTARATMSFGRAACEQTFLVEVVAGDVVRRVRLAPEAPGVFAASWTFATDAPGTPIEMRIVMETGAIEGSIALLEVVLLEQQAESDPRLLQTRDDLRPRRA